MCLECLEFPDQHFVIGISGDKYHIVEVPVKGKFVGIECKPSVNTLFNHSCHLAVLVLYLAKMLVMKYHIVLYECIFELALRIEQLLRTCIIYSIASLVKVTFSDYQPFSRNSFECFEFLWNETEQSFQVCM